MEVEFIQINTSTIGLIENLAIEAHSEGFNFVRRAIDEWKSGMNDFSKEGEILFGVFISNSCIGIGGLNVDPYIEEPGTGRIRHIYISQKCRRKGYATLLLRKIIRMAAKDFKILRLYTDIPNASSLYESLGFIRSSGFKVSHVLKDLKKLT